MLPSFAPRSASRALVRGKRPIVFRSLYSTPVQFMNSYLPPVEHPVSSALPADAYQLLPAVEKLGASEDALFEQEVQDVEQWWATPRYEGIKRPYSAEDIVSKRGSLQQTYPSSLMARKLFNLFKERAAKGEPVHTSTLSLIELSHVHD